VGTPEVGTSDLTVCHVGVAITLAAALAIFRLAWPVPWVLAASAQLRVAGSAACPVTGCRGAGRRQHPATDLNAVPSPLLPGAGRRPALEDSARAGTQRRGGPGPGAPTVDSHVPLNVD
jgi:hypothetical protein